MAKQLIECVPNFSEGRRSEVIEAIVAPLRKKKGCAVLDFRAHPDHNRLVVSLVGEPEPIQEALLEAAQIAISRIDLNHHQGGHPRRGGGCHSLCSPPKHNHGSLRGACSRLRPQVL